jgi:hypothetical protein
MIGTCFESVGKYLLQEKMWNVKCSIFYRALDFMKISKLFLLSGHAMEGFAGDGWEVCKNVCILPR